MSHSDLILRVKEILLPLVAADDQREALLIDAFYLSDSRLFYEIDRKGAASVFASLLLKKLIDYGSTVEGRHPTAHLLATARFHYGGDKHAEKASLILAGSMAWQQRKRIAHWVNRRSSSRIIHGKE